MAEQRFLLKFALPKEGQRDPYVFGRALRGHATWSLTRIDRRAPTEGDELFVWVLAIGSDCQTMRQEIQAEVFDIVTNVNAHSRLLDILPRC
jgi:hypothetical protein